MLMVQEKMQKNSWHCSFHRVLIAWKSRDDARGSLAKSFNGESLGFLLLREVFICFAFLASDPLSNEAGASYLSLPSTFSS